MVRRHDEDLHPLAIPRHRRLGDPAQRPPGGGLEVRGAEAVGGPDLTRRLAVEQAGLAVDEQLHPFRHAEDRFAKPDDGGDALQAGEAGAVRGRAPCGAGHAEDLRGIEEGSQVWRQVPYKEDPGPGEAAGAGVGRLAVGDARGRRDPVEAEGFGEGGGRGRLGRRII